MLSLLTQRHPYSPALDIGTPGFQAFGLSPGFIPLASDSLGFALVLNYITSFLGSPVCRLQTMELLSLQNPITMQVNSCTKSPDICVLLVLFLWRILTKTLPHPHYEFLEVEDFVLRW